MPKSTLKSGKPTPRSAAADSRKATSYHHGDLPNALIAEGRQLLEDIGLGEFSLREVARRVGVSEAAPGRHFDGKTGLLAAIAASGFRELAGLRRAIAAKKSSEMQKAYDMLAIYVEFAQTHKGLFYLMVGPRVLEKNAFPEIGIAQKEAFNLFADAVSALAASNGWPEGARNYVTHAAWSVEHGLANLILASRVPLVDRPIDIPSMVKFSLALLLGAVAVGPEVLPLKFRKEIGESLQ